MDTKVCKSCGKEKPLSDFYKKRNSFEGSCKKCKEEKRRNRHKKVCKFCQKEFTTGDKNAIYCSNSCHGKDRSKQVSFKCDYCGKYHSDKKSHYDNKINHFCSTECMHKFQSINWKGENSPLYNRIKCTCDNCGKEIYIVPSQYIKNQNNFCSVECMGKWRIGRFCGENSPRWNNNISSHEREIGRKIVGYNDFIKAVYKRDNYQCVCCGQKGNGSNLNAHHLDGYNWCKDKRTDVNNGVTLCKECHEGFHSIYGKGNNTKEQFNEWINNGINKKKGA